MSAKKLVIKKKTPKFTLHAKFRAHERFTHTLEEMIDDLRHHRKSVWLKADGVYWVRWELWIYVIDKNFNIITVYKNDKKNNTNIHGTDNVMISSDDSNRPD